MKYFGKGCTYFTGAFADEKRRKEEGEPNFEDEEPELTFCNHKENEDKCEGNCCERLCPLKFTKAVFDHTFVELMEPLPGTVFSKFKESIRAALGRSNKQCPCVSDVSLQSKDTVCPCRVYRETLECKCNLYVKLQ